MAAAAVLQRRIHGLRDQLVRFAERRVPGHGEEIAQETWLRVTRARPSCPDDAAFRAYAYAVARRLIIDHHRKRAHRVTLVPLEGGMSARAEDGDPHGSVLAGEVLKVVETELSAMKKDVADVFRWRLTEDWSFQEIARMQGVSINTALGRMHQATRRLARALQSAGLCEEGET